MLLLLCFWFHMSIDLENMNYSSVIAEYKI
jgi:hypothetical protein